MHASCSLMYGPLLQGDKVHLINPVLRMCSMPELAQLTA